MWRLSELLFELWETFWYEYVCKFWDWFWYYRNGKIKFYVFNNGDHYKVAASNGKMTIYNCYGGTLEQAKEMALWRLKKCYEDKKAPL